MKTVYNISIWAYLLLINIYAIFNAKAKLWIEGRKDIFKKITAAVKDEKNTVWFHCASLGEFEQAKPIIQSYRVRYPDHKILLTFFSPSGFNIQKNTQLANWVFYLPHDTKGNAKKFLDIVQPIKAIFIKYEFWFNYLHELNKKNIPVYSVSAKFRDNQPFFKYKWWGQQLTNMTHFFVQDKDSASLLKSIKISNHTISGDTRFDSVIKNSQAPIKIPLIENFSKNKTTIICGSTWPKDESLVVKYIKSFPEKKYIIAPHEMNNIAKLQKETNGILYSKANDKNITTNNVLIIDSIGLLSSLYQYGHIAYIGGGFGNGIHNILEASAFGLPTIFGPNYLRFNEATSLINKKGAISISNYKELVDAISKLTNFNKSICTKYVKENSGATEIIISKI